MKTTKQILRSLVVVLMTSLMFVSAVSCAEEEQKPAPKKPKLALSSGNYEATGTINGKTKFTMNFTVRGKKLAGTYYYNKYGPGATIDIVGVVGVSKVKIQEYARGYNSGDFDGEVIGQEFVGTFTNHTTYKTSRFEVHLDKVSGAEDYFQTVNAVSLYAFDDVPDPVEMVGEAMAQAESEIDGIVDEAMSDSDNVVNSAPSEPAPLWVWVVFGVLMALGFIGCFINKVPGPVFAFIALLLFHFCGLSIPWWVLIVAFLLVGGSVVLEYFVVPMLAKMVHEYGKSGVWGTIVGSILTLPILLFGNWIVGLIVFLTTTFALAFLFEFVATKNAGQGLARACGAYITFVTSTVVKILVCFFCFYFVVAGTTYQAESDIEDAMEQVQAAQDEYNDAVSSMFE